MAQYDINNFGSNDNKTILVDLSHYNHENHYNRMLEVIKSDFKDKLPTLGPKETIRSTLLWDIITGDNVVFAAIAGILGLCALITLILTLYILLKRNNWYERVVCSDERLQDYFHKSTSHYIDEEYENTFTGVSIPLMQDVSKV